MDNRYLFLYLKILYNLSKDYLHVFNELIIVLPVKQCLVFLPTFNYK